MRFYVKVNSAIKIEILILLSVYISYRSRGEIIVEV